MLFLFFKPIGTLLCFSLSLSISFEKSFYPILTGEHTASTVEVEVQSTCALAVPINPIRISSNPLRTCFPGDLQASLLLLSELTYFKPGSVGYRDGDFGSGLFFFFPRGLHLGFFIERIV